MSEEMVASAVMLSRRVDREPWFGLSQGEQYRLKRKAAEVQGRVLKITKESQWKRVNGRWAWLSSRSCPDCSGVLVLGLWRGNGEPGKVYCRGCRRVLVHVVE